MNNRREPYPNELYHYGVKGMKWRQRKHSSGYDALVEQRMRQKRKHKAKQSSIDSKLSRFGVHANREPSSGFRDAKNRREERTMHNLNEHLRQFTKEGFADQRAKKRFEVDETTRGSKAMYKALNPEQQVFDDVRDKFIRNHNKNSLRAKAKRAFNNASKTFKESYRVGTPVYTAYKEAARRVRKRRKGHK